MKQLDEMNLIEWIDCNLSELQGSDAFDYFFAKTEIELIEDEKYLFNPEMGIDVVLSNTDIVTSIHLFSGSSSTAKQFPRELIQGLAFEMNKASVRNVLGTPNRTGGGYVDLTGGVPHWDKYYYSRYSLHIQYSPLDETIDLVTIGSFTLEPYLNSHLQ